MGAGWWGCGGHLDHQARPHPRCCVLAAQLRLACASTQPLLQLTCTACPSALHAATSATLAASSARRTAPSAAAHQASSSCRRRADWNLTSRRTSSHRCCAAGLGARRAPRAGEGLQGALGPARATAGERGTASRALRRARGARGGRRGASRPAKRWLASGILPSYTPTVCATRKLPPLARHWTHARGAPSALRTPANPCAAAARPGRRPARRRASRRRPGTRTAAPAWPGPGPSRRPGAAAWPGSRRGAGTAAGKGAEASFEHRPLATARVWRLVDVRGPGKGCACMQPQHPTLSPAWSRRALYARLCDASALSTARCTTADATLPSRRRGPLGRAPRGSAAAEGVACSSGGRQRVGCEQGAVAQSCPQATALTPAFTPAIASCQRLAAQLPLRWAREPHLLRRCVRVAHRRQLGGPKRVRHQRRLLRGHQLPQRAAGQHQHLVGRPKALDGHLRRRRRAGENAQELSKSGGGCDGASLDPCTHMRALHRSAVQGSPRTLPTGRAPAAASPAPPPRRVPHAAPSATPPAAARSCRSHSRRSASAGGGPRTPAAARLAGRTRASAPGPRGPAAAAAAAKVRSPAARARAPVAAGRGPAAAAAFAPRALQPPGAAPAPHRWRWMMHAFWVGRDDVRGLRSRGHPRL